MEEEAETLPWYAHVDCTWTRVAVSKHVPVQDILCTEYPHFDEELLCNEDTQWIVLDEEKMRAEIKRLSQASGPHTIKIEKESGTAEPSAEITIVDDQCRIVCKDPLTLSDLYDL